MLLMETCETLDVREEPVLSDNALNGNSLNLGKITFFLFSKSFCSASPVLWDPLDNFLVGEKQYIIFITHKLNGSFVIHSVSQLGIINCVFLKLV